MCLKAQSSKVETGMGVATGIVSATTASARSQREQALGSFGSARCGVRQRRNRRDVRPFPLSRF